MIFDNHRVVKPAPDNMNYERPWLKFYGKDTLPNLEYQDKSFYEYLVDSTRCRPDIAAINFMGRQIKYSELLSSVDACSKGLYEMGVREGDVFTVCLPNIPHTIIIFYALNKLGAIVNMIHPLCAPKEIQYAMELTKSKFIITTDLFYKNLKVVRHELDVNKIIVCSIPEYLNTVLSIAFWVKAGRKIEKIDYAKDTALVKWSEMMTTGKGSSAIFKNTKNYKDGAVILYSGGTTGKQKGVLLSTLNLNAMALQMVSHQEVDLKDDTKMMCILPLFHGFGLGVCMHAPIMMGATIVLVPKFSADDFAKVFAKYKPDYMAGVPTLYEALLRSETMKNADFTSLKGAFSGGDSLPESLKHRFDKFIAERGGTNKLQEGYGLTETVSASCVTPIGHYKSGSVGVPAPDMLYKIVEPSTENSCDTGVEGEICICGPTVMMEYYNEPEETALVLRKHSDGRTWLHTGDMGHMDEDGFVFFKLRIKRIIKSSGYSVYPTQIEEVIDKHEAVNMCCVIGVPDDYQVERITAVIVLNEGYSPSEELKESILKLCREYLAKWSTPRDIDFRDSLPMTKVGKIAYVELEKEYKAKV